MPTFIVTDPETGRKLKLTGDSPPTEQELEQIFAQSAPAQPVDPRFELQDLLIAQAQGAQVDPARIQELRQQTGEFDTSGDASQLRPRETEVRSGLTPATMAANVVGRMFGAGDIGTSAGSLARGVQQGMTTVGQGALGFGARGAEALGIEGAEDFRRDLQSSTALERTATEEITQDAPIAGFTGEMLGAVAALPVPAAAPVRVAGATISAPAVATVAGAGLGALAAEGEGRDPVTGAVIGGITGGLIRKGEDIIRAGFRNRAAQNEQIKQIILREEANVDILGAELVDDLAKGTTKVVTNPQLKSRVNNAINEGFNDRTLALTAAANPATRAEMRKMATIIEKGIKDQTFRDNNRASDVVGNALMKRYDSIVKANRKAGKAISRIANSELKGKTFDASGQAENFRRRLQEDLKIRFDNAGNPIFEGSNITLNPNDATVIRDTLTRLNQFGAIRGDDLHNFKRVLSESIDFDSQGQGVSGTVQSVLRDLREGVNQKLRRSSSRYAKANDVFSETIEPINLLQDLSGKRIDLTSQNAEKAVGTLLRRELGNAQSRVPIVELRKQIDSLAKKHNPKGQFNDDLEKLNSLAMSLELMFKDQARSSGRAQFGGEAATLLNANQIERMKWLTDKLSRPKNEQTAINALKELLNNG